MSDRSIGNVLGHVEKRLVADTSAVKFLLDGFKEIKAAVLDKLFPLFVARVREIRFAFFDIAFVALVIGLIHTITSRPEIKCDLAQSISSSGRSIVSKIAESFDFIATIDGDSLITRAVFAAHDIIDHLTVLLPHVIHATLRVKFRPLDDASLSLDLVPIEAEHNGACDQANGTDDESNDAVG